MAVRVPKTFQILSAGRASARGLARPPSLAPRLHSRYQSSTAADSTIEVEDRDGIRWITLNRPKQLNALTLPDLDAFSAAVEEAGADVRAIAVLGSGRAFCAGMNTKAFEGLDKEAAREVIKKVGRAVGSLRLSPKPTAVLMHGYCIGAAFEMALAADFRIAERNTKAGLPETKVGIPSVLDSQLLQHHVGLSLAKEMTLLGDLQPVERLGDNFVNRYAETGKLVETATELLSRFKDYTPVVLAAQKDLHEAWLTLPIKKGVEYSIDVFAEVFSDPATHAAVEKYNKK